MATHPPDLPTTAREDVETSGSSLPIWLEPAVLAAIIGVAAATIWLLTQSDRSTLLSPWAVTGLLVANLLPALALLVLIGRRVAKRRALRRGDARARLHTRLVALFSVTATIPTLLVVIFSSFLFQSGMDFWFSDRSRGMFENAVGVAQSFIAQERRDVSVNTQRMADDLRVELTRTPINSQPFDNYFVQQLVVRELSAASIIEVGADGIARTVKIIDPDNRSASNRITAATFERLMAGQAVVAQETDGGIEAVVRLQPGRPVFLFAERRADLLGMEPLRASRSVFADYNALFARANALQYRFIAALYIGSLLLVALVITVAIRIADRIVRPIDELVHAAQRVSGGDLDTRVPVETGQDDEISTLANAFNAMTTRIGKQTRDIMEANAQNEDRRVFIEAVLSAVASGVISLHRDRTIRLANSAAAMFFKASVDALGGQPLATVAPDLDDWVQDDRRDPIMSISVDGELRTLVAKIAEDEHGYVLTFEDITRQLYDQRRAAWSDVARRVAHEIKNPLTPIQLAAERLQRRFGAAVSQDADMFKRLTSTIVRQVGDLRRMVDEFSSFARMPKPLFKEENLADIVRQSVFLHEVATPSIRFSVAGSADVIDLVCDRRLLSQCFMNVLKNAVEAIERIGRNDGAICVSISTTENGAAVEIEDNGEGLPADRASIVEPYVTTREGGTGLGLAIVKRIVEEHGGTLSFADREGGGTRAIITLTNQSAANAGAVQADLRDGSERLNPMKARSKRAIRVTSSEGSDHGA